MADFTVDGTTRVSYVPAIANTAAPTTTELNAGTILTSKIMGDGLIGFEAATAAVDNGSLASRVDTEVPGRESYSGSALRFKKQATADTIYSLMVRDLGGYIVIRRDLAQATAWAAGQAVDVFPMILGQTKRPAPAKNTLGMYEVPVFVSDDPALRSTVA